MRKSQQLLSEEKRILFCIASHFMEVIIPNTFNWERFLWSFRPFRCDSAEGKDVMCSIRLVEKPIHIESNPANVLNQASGIVGHWFCLMETEQDYIADIQFIENGEHYLMIFDKTFSTATIYIDWKDEDADIILSTFMTIIFTHAAILHKTLLIHASVVEKEQKGYAFLGKSGTGKSTHSSLWLRYVGETNLLNDDCPAIRIEEDGKVYVYGTPWSGKKPCYKNRKVELKALVRLEQATTNHFTWKKGVDALITLLPSCSSMRWNEMLYTKMCNLLEEIIDKVNIGYLECLPDKDAALLCYQEIKNRI